MIFVLLVAPFALYRVRKRNIRSRAITGISMFIGGLIVAGGLAFAPGRLLNTVTPGY